MTPTPQQINILQQKLRKILTYRETYEEVYDHILSALVNEPDNMPMGDAMNKIVRADFGGMKKLQLLEKTTKRILVKETIQKYLGFLKWFFKLPTLFFTVAISAVFCYFILQLHLSLRFWETLFFVVLFIPEIIMQVRYFKTGYILRDSKTSAKDRIFANLSRLPLRCVMAIFAISSIYKIDYTPLTICIAFIVVVIHGLAIMKLYRDEFKMVLVNY